ncbi:MAG: riboflavin kinase, partial [Akkermansia sp.]|nr:riboflavin kinase [Akkermansia sp.]
DHTTSPRLEVHLLHFHGDLYGLRLHTELLRFLRPEQRFNSIDELQAQISRDLAML